LPTDSHRPLIVLSGPSGVGKGTLCRQLLDARQDIRLCVSATTRVARPEEVDGLHYHFLSLDAFHTAVAAGDFLEWAEFAGHCYGTLRHEVQSVVAAGCIPMVEIDVNGAKQIRQNYPEALLIFIQPPSLDELRRRLEVRGVNTEADMTRRLAIATAEMREANAFDCVIPNDALPVALADIQAAIAGYLKQCV
jgi:guanylate kinase